MNLRGTRRFALNTCQRSGQVERGVRFTHCPLHFARPAGGRTGRAPLIVYGSSCRYDLYISGVPHRAHIPVGAWRVALCVAPPGNGCHGKSIAIVEVAAIL
jgi:hypothetical protein